jgi:acyl carrier protein
MTTDEVRTALGDIWAGAVHVRPRDDDDFFMLGGGSMEMIVMLVTVQERFGIDIPIEDFFAEDFTFGRCVSAVTRALGAAPGGPAR